MSEIIYQIDKDLSLQNECLVIKIEEAERAGSGLLRPNSLRPLTRKTIDGLADQRERELLQLLMSQKELGSFFFQVSYSAQFSMIKLLAATGKLYFQDRQLMVDIFSKNHFCYRISQKGSIFAVRGKIKTDDSEIDVHECDLLCDGNPLWFIKGPFLKIIATDVAWKEIKKTLNKEPWLIESLGEFIERNKDPDPNAPQILIDEGIEDTKQIEPFPLLFLKDRTGAFADLWMTYGADEKVCVHDSHYKIRIKRDFDAEKNWEKDLLETDFIRKNCDGSHYYCPLNKVAHALGFMLDLGWTIIDYQGRKILNSKKASLTLFEEGDVVRANGKIHYGDYRIDVSNVVGAFNRKERFISLGEGEVGLLPDKWEDPMLQTLCEEGTFVQEKACMSKSLFLSIASKEDVPHEIETSLIDKIKLLKNALQKPFTTGKSFSGSLRSYQQEGLNWLGTLYASGLHGLLADDMGLGKTVQVLAFLSQIETTKPCLIIMPSSLLFSWKKEVEKFLGDTPYLHQGVNRLKTAEELSCQKIIICSYTTLRIDLSIFQQLHYECLILDEAQSIKNSDTQSAQAVFSLKARFRLSLSGTPVENRLEELWSQFHFLIPNLLGSQIEFSSLLQASSVDSRHLQKIKNKVHPFILRRRKSEVAKDLPEKINQVIWLEMPESQRRIYNEFLSGVRGNLLKKVSLEGVAQYRIEILEAILRLRQICCHPLLISSALDNETNIESVKMQQLLDDLEVLQAQKQKALVYSQFSSLLKILGRAIKERGWTFVLLDGGTTQREKVVQQFQEDPECTIFLISLKAGGVGLNLTQADTVFLYEPWWNESVENQAIDRAHRIGREAPVLAKRYIVAESIEERMMKLKSSKNALIDHLFDEQQSVDLFTEENLEFLFS